MPEVRLITLLVLLISPLSLMAAEPPTALEWKDFRGTVFQSDDLLIGGQPLTDSAMQKLKSEGIGTIINLRTPEEMANPKTALVEEPGLAASLGMDYHHLPSGGPDYPYSPATVKAMNNIISSSDGKVYLHCNSARRATHLWVAWLMQHQGLSVEEAISLGRQANFGEVPLEGFSPKPLTYKYSQPAN